MNNAICVYSSSSDALAVEYVTAARDLGTLMAQQGYTLVYGGTHTGLMGELARSIHANDGRVIGVVPEVIRTRDITYERADELIVTTDLRERKATMERLADAFIALPGGFGTLEEVAEVLTLKQLQVHTKPIVFINTSGFYDRLNAFFEQLYAEHFAKEQYRSLYHMAAEAAHALDYIQTYQPPNLTSKWY
jgi:cytokinin riboside 5'-monophosphate phosphoribohydrolase